MENFRNQAVVEEEDLDFLEQETKYAKEYVKDIQNKDYIVEKS